MLSAQRLRAMLLAIGLLIFGGEAQADSGAPDALIWVKSDEDRALIERIRGQVVDLEVGLRVQPTEETWPSTAKTQGVFAIVWFSRPDPSVDRLIVHVTATEGSPRRMLVREVGAGTRTQGGALSSATLESAALVVREALRELSLPDPEPASKTQPREVDEPPPPALPVLHGDIFGEFSWLGVADGVGSPLTIGPALRVGLGWKSLTVSAFGTTGLPAETNDEYGTMRFRRHSLGVRSGYRRDLSTQLRLDLGLVFGAAFYERRVLETVAAVVDSEDGQTQSLLVGPEVRFGWQIGSTPLELGVLGALYIVPGAPRVGYQSDDGFQESLGVSRLQPSFGITAKFRSKRFW